MRTKQITSRIYWKFTLRNHYSRLKREVGEWCQARRKAFSRVRASYARSWPRLARLKSRA